MTPTMRTLSQLVDPVLTANSKIAPTAIRKIPVPVLIARLPPAGCWPDWPSPMKPFILNIL